MAEVFSPDYHESEEAWPVVYNLGRLSLEWNMVEQFLTGLIWQLLGDHNVGMAVTGGLGNQSRAQIALSLARQKGLPKETLNKFDFACRAFNVLRENRNMLIHSHSIFRTDDGTIHWRRATGKGPSGHLTLAASFDDLEEMIQATVNVGFLFVDLGGAIVAHRDGSVWSPRSADFAPPRKLRIAELDEALA